MARKMIGIDLGGTFIKAGVVDDKGRVLSRVKKPTDTAEGRDTIIRNIAAAVVEAREQAGVNWRSISAVGLGAPGLFEQPSGIVSQSPNLPVLAGKVLAPPVMKAAGHPEIPVVLENDANVAAFAEAWIGCARGVGTMALMTLGTGIGGGIVLNGEIWRGFRGVAGEVGHQNLFPNGVRCGCGNRGCLEAYASATALVRRLKKAVRDGKRTRLTAELQRGAPVSARDICEAAIAGDPLCLALMEETGSFLGIAVMNMLHILNIELVAFTGGMTAAGDLLLNSIRNEARERTLLLAMKGVKIVFSNMGDDAGLIGAAGWALRRTHGLRLGGRA
ncbi:MAG: ROK family protein [Candidatus Brocadiia bacterium]|jgi:glucokinase